MSWHMPCLVTNLCSAGRLAALWATLPTPHCCRVALSHPSCMLCKQLLHHSLGKGGCMLLVAPLRSQPAEVAGVWAVSACRCFGRKRVASRAAQPNLLYIPINLV